ncbi:MarR family transcriptional regulator [Microcoleus sp. B7-D4]|uniref:MarR family transcriptional regulator n=1 Tax=Microcoleus sp. B7-D4 TaxID=2818696 RepID=UPI002FD6BC7F
MVGWKQHKFRSRTRFTLSSLRTIRIVNISGRGRIPAFSVAFDRQKTDLHPLGLWQEDGLPTSSIGDKLQQVGGRLTGAIDRMEETGLVRRERDTRDRHIWLRHSGVVCDPKAMAAAVVTELVSQHFANFIELVRLEQAGGVCQGHRRGGVIGCGWSNHGELHRTFFNNYIMLDRISQSLH